MNVKSIKVLAMLLTLAAPLTLLNEANAADTEAGLVAIRSLGSLNGQALACSEKPSAAWAKSLMLAHAPKTARFGAAYAEATHAAYLEQTRSTVACPDAKSLTARLNELASQLRETLPVASTDAK